MIQYLIQVTAYTGCMLLLYHLLLRDKPLHGFNRMYLLSAAILPALLPLLKLPAAFRPRQEAKPLVAMLQEVTVGGAEEQQAIPVWLLIIPAIYLAVMLGILVAKMAGYIKMRGVISRSCLPAGLRSRQAPGKRRRDVTRRQIPHAPGRCSACPGPWPARTGRPGCCR